MSNFATSPLSSKFLFWNKLSPVEAASITSHARQESFHKGEVINRSAEECRGLMSLSKGQLRVYFISEDGREVTLFRLMTGDVCALSASCLLDSIAFDVVIEAVEDTEVTLIPSQILHRIIEKNPYVELFMSKTLNERFTDAMLTMQQMLFMGADRRVAIFLWDEYAKTGSPVISYTHDEIARLIGSAREVVSRILNIFKKEGIVALSRGKVEIINKQKLKDLL